MEERVKRRLKLKVSEEGLENFIEITDPINSEAVKKVIEDSAEKIAEVAGETVEGVAGAVASIISDSL